jgi:hypothetical protein
MDLVRRHLRHACAAAAAGAALCLAAPATAAAAAPGRAQSSVPAVSGRLYGTAATSASDVWAVGLDPGGALIMQWNGTAWSSSSLNDSGFLEGVAATSAGNAWSVGGTDWFSPATLIYHWDGSTWTRQASPNPGGGGFLNGVAAASASDAWAVGLIGGGPGAGTGPGDKTLIDHWDGTSWNVVPVPASIGTHIRLNAVTATSASNAWAVGSTTTGPDYGVILHWNGTTWRKVTAHSPTGSLLGVSASSPSNTWAVGTTDYASTLIVHWNGTSGS